MALPYGTGNDLARVTKWGGTPSGKIYKDVQSIVINICEHSQVRDFNVWNVEAKFKPDGAIYDFNSKTQQVEAREKPEYERDMINYFGIGEDGRIGFAVEKRRTANRYLNKFLYFFYGVEFFCCPRRDAIADIVDYVKTDIPTSTYNTGVGHQSMAEDYSRAEE